MCSHTDEKEHLVQPVTVSISEFLIVRTTEIKVNKGYINFSS